MGRVSPVVRQIVLARDRRCIASLVWPHACRDQFGTIHPATDLRRLELDHVREAPMMGKEPESRPEHLVALCHYAHQPSGWATSHRHILRAYLASQELAQHARKADLARFRREHFHA